MKGFGGGGMQQLMRQANQMQNKMKKLQEELSLKEFEGAAGGGAVTVKVNGDSHLIAVQIQPEVLAEGDVEMLQEMLVIAANEAIKTAKETSEKEMSKITGGLNFPGMF